MTVPDHLNLPAFSDECLPVAQPGTPSHRREQSRMTETSEAFDKNGIPFAVGDVVKVFHFIGARRKRHYMYKQVVGERVWPSGYRCWVFSHLNMKSAEDRDGGFYVARDGATLEDYEIVQCCSAYPEHFSTRSKEDQPDHSPDAGNMIASLTRKDGSEGVDRERLADLWNERHPSDEHLPFHAVWSLLAALREGASREG